ncbi:glycosyltransferase family 2 protein [bacterium]|nr:glycosyltransferase family 2 protein [bacterium]
MMKAKIKEHISVVIIHFNSDLYIRDCIKCLNVQNDIDCEIIIIDNASENNLQNELKDLSKNIVYIRSDKNLGAARANNLGIEKANSEYIAILNADVFLNPDYLIKCVSKLQKHKNVSEVQGLLISSANDNIIDSAGVDFFYNGLAADKNHGDSISSLSHINEDEISIDGTCCAAAVYKKSVLEKVKTKHGIYNERLFAFFEDFELSARMRAAGTQALLVRDARGRHVRGGSTRHQSKFVRLLHIKNIYIINNYIFRLGMMRKIAFNIYFLFTLMRNIDLIKDILKFIISSKELERENFQRYGYTGIKSYLKFKLRKVVS